MQAMKEWYQTHPHLFGDHMIVRDATLRPVTKHKGPAFMVGRQRPIPEI